MSDAEAIQTEADPEPQEGEAAAKKRSVSTIRFPYLDLNDGVDVVKAIHNNAGNECSLEQLAGYMKQTSTSGAFKEKVRTAGIFGLTEGSVRLTPVGRLIVDPQKERVGRAQAFLRVPLYNAIYEKYKTGLLPPDIAIEREMVALGVAEKQKAKARQAFQRSAQQAGFSEQGKDRLVQPAGAGVQAPAPADPPVSRMTPNGGGRPGGFLPPSGLPPKVKMLLRVLPPDGETWPDDEQDAWLDSMRDALRESYTPEASAIGDGEEPN